MTTVFKYFANISILRYFICLCVVSIFPSFYHADCADDLIKKFAFDSDNAVVDVQELRNCLGYDFKDYLSIMSISYAKKITNEKYFFYITGIKKISAKTSLYCDLFILHEVNKNSFIREFATDSIQRVDDSKRERYYKLGETDIDYVSNDSCIVIYFLTYRIFRTDTLGFKFYEDLTPVIKTDTVTLCAGQ